MREDLALGFIIGLATGCIPSIPESVQVWQDKPDLRIYVLLPYTALVLAFAILVFRYEKPHRR